MIPDLATLPERLQADPDPLAETGWQTLARYARLIVGDFSDAMARYAIGLYASGVAGALFWWWA